MASAFAIMAPDHRGARLLRLLALGSSYAAMILAAVGTVRRSRVAGSELNEWDEALALTLVALLAYVAGQVFG